MEDIEGLEGMEKHKEVGETRQVTLLSGVVAVGSVLSLQQ